MSCFNSKLGRWLLVAVVLVCIAGLFVVGLPLYRQQSAATAVERFGGTISWVQQGPTWLVELLGEERMQIFATPVSVHFNECQLNNENVRRLKDHLEEFPELVKLFVSGTELTDQGLAELVSSSDLRVLWLDGTNVTDEGLKHLRFCPRLLVLGLSVSQITDKGIDQLVRLKELQYLLLDHTAVTDQGVIRLRKLKNLTYLSLSNTDVSDDAIRTLEEAHPNLTVTDD